MAAVYWSVVQAAWLITKDWISAASLVSKVVWAIVLFTGGVVVFALPSVVRGRGWGPIVTQIGRRVLEGSAGLAFALVVLFLISFFYYAPPLVLAKYEKQAADQAVRQQQKIDAKEYNDYRMKVKTILDRIETDSYKNQMGNQVGKACDSLMSARQEEEKAQAECADFESKEPAKRAEIHKTCLTAGGVPPSLCEARSLDYLGTDKMQLQQRVNELKDA
jgi:hypothetical protein